LNRNKRSIVLDLKKPADIEALLGLTADTDVFLHSIRPQKLRKLGLDAETMTARFPRLIYAGFHGFEEAGPYGGRPAYDDIIQGLSGNADLMHRQGGEPHYFPTITADKTTGLVGAMAILAALVRRERTGQGGTIEIPMFETTSAFNLVEHLYGAHFDPPQGGMGYPRALSPSRKPYATADGYVCMMPYTDQHWRDFFVVAGAEPLVEDCRFKDMANRTANIDTLYAIAAEQIIKRPTSFWIEACERLHIPAAPILSLDDLTSDRHLAEVGFFVMKEDARMGRVRFPGVPVRFDGERPPVGFPPRLGEHNAEVLRQAGLDEKDAAGASDG
jgi:crotonobetainyl-CoA:carnitine CoA-transferase CaiB-like acyl-CoA transferase